MRSDMPGAGARGAAEGAARRATREAAPWVEKLARFGYAAKGAVYILVGGLAVAAAFGGGGQTTGSSGALATISDSTLGRVALGLIALGLVGYVVWGAVRAIVNPEHDGAGKRAYYGVTAAVYGLLAVEAARLAVSGPTGGSGGMGGGGGMAGARGGWGSPGRIVRAGAPARATAGGAQLPATGCRSWVRVGSGRGRRSPGGVDRLEAGG